MDLKPGVVEAIEAMFALCEAINKNELTTAELAEGCRRAISDGHEMAQIDLVMMCEAVRLASEAAYVSSVPCP